jgi:hypothetical protein
LSKNAVPIWHSSPKFAGDLTAKPSTEEISIFIDTNNAAMRIVNEHDHHMTWIKLGSLNLKH